MFTRTRVDEASRRQSGLKAQAKRRTWVMGGKDTQKLRRERVLQRVRQRSEAQRKDRLTHLAILATCGPE